MHLLYVDESGSASNQRFLVLAGLSVFERQAFWISSQLDKLAASINPADPYAIEFHANHMFQGKGFWRSLPTNQRIELMMECLSVFSSSHNSNRIFACVADKELLTGKDPLLTAFEQVVTRFDYYLNRLYKQNDTQRGIMIFDKSTYEETFQALARDFRSLGHRWGILNNLAEVPLFIDSQASRLIQLADMVAYSLYRFYERQDNRFYSIIKNRFDFYGNKQHGLCELIK